jgi:hypothetical protein
MDYVLVMEIIMGIAVLGMCGSLLYIEFKKG